MGLTTIAISMVVISIFAADMFAGLIFAPDKQHGGNIPLLSIVVNHNDEVGRVFPFAREAPIPSSPRRNVTSVIPVETGIQVGVCLNQDLPD